MSLERLSWKETFSRLRADHHRLATVLAAHDGPASNALLHPSFICVLLYRVSSQFFRAGHRYLARFFWHLNFLLTGADVSPLSDLGGGLLIMSPAGTSIMGHAGRNLTVMPCAGLGGEVGRWEDVGGGPGLPCLGDDVVLEPHCGVLGPVRVGHRVRVGGNIPLVQDVADDTVVEGPRPRFVKRRDLT